jgi:M6 family metalloprotease-like protein
VEFADLKAKNTPIKDFADVKYQLEHFWQRMSSKPLNFEVRIPDKYLTMPKKIADYNLSGVFNSPSQNISATFAYSKEAAAVADPSIDFTEADVIVIAHLPEATRAQIGTFVAEAAMPNSSSVINTNERKIYNIMIQGDDQQRDIYNWTHEFGHMLGMTDFNHEGPLDNSKNVGKGFYDIMTSYRNMELLAWHRFLLGILNDDQVACVTTGASTHWLRPVEWPTKKQKAVIVPLSATSVLVVESRRRLGYDAMLGKQGEGALVYKIDTTISGSGGTNPLTIVSPPRTGSADIRTNPTLKMGESVLTDGWRISVVESGGFGDVIKVEKQ